MLWHGKVLPSWFAHLFAELIQCRLSCMTSAPHLKKQLSPVADMNVDIKSISEFLFKNLEKVANDTHDLILFETKGK